MHRLSIALIIPDGVSRLGMISMIKQSNYNSCALADFEHFESFCEYKNTVHLMYYDISSVVIDDVENHMRQLKTAYPETMTVIISNQLAVLHIHRIQQLGAKGFIYRDELESMLLQSIDIVIRGLIVYSPQVQNLLMSKDKLYLANELRDIDIKVLRLMAGGSSTKEIASQLDVSTKTIYRIRDRLKDILDVPNAEMILGAAQEQGLLDDPPQ